MKIREGFVGMRSSIIFIVARGRLHSLEDVHKVLEKGGAIRAETNSWGSNGLSCLKYANHKDLFDNYFEK